MGLKTSSTNSVVNALMNFLSSSLLQLFSEKPPQSSRWTPVLWPGGEETTWRRRSGTRLEHWQTVRSWIRLMAHTASSTLHLRTVTHLDLCVHSCVTVVSQIIDPPGLMYLQDKWKLYKCLCPEVIWPTTSWKQQLVRALSSHFYLKSNKCYTVMKFGYVKLSKH